MDPHRVSLLVLHLVLMASSSLALDSCRLQDGYETFPSVPGSRYKLYNVAKNWTEAQATCQSDGIGSNLVVINSRKEAAVVKQLFARTPNQWWILVGINDIVLEGNWVTVQGGPVSKSGYNEWATGEPNSEDGNEDCGAVNMNAELNDAKCDYGYFFICEKKERN